MDKFVIECRYEIWTINGKKFNDWYVWHSAPVTEQEGNEIINNAKTEFEYIDKKTKLAHEYRLSSYNEYLKKRNELNKYITKNSKRQEAYLKSDKYKELQKKKRQAAKDRKERKQLYEAAMLEEALNK